MFGAIGDRGGSRLLGSFRCSSQMRSGPRRDQAGGKRKRDSEADDGGKAKRRLE